MKSNPRVLECSVTMDFVVPAALAAWYERVREMMASVARKAATHAAPNHKRFRTGAARSAGNKMVCNGSIAQFRPNSVVSLLPGPYGTFARLRGHRARESGAVMPIDWEVMRRVAAQVFPSVFFRGRNRVKASSELKPRRRPSDERHAVVSRAGDPKCIRRSVRGNDTAKRLLRLDVARSASALVQTPRSGGQPPRRAAEEPQLRRVAAAPMAPCGVVSRRGR
jgi:hypothetical protein